MTLAQLKTDIGYQADVVLGASSRYTPTMVTRFINQSIQRFRERVSCEGITRYLVSYSAFTQVGATSPFPFQTLDLSGIDPPVVRVFGIDVKYQNTWRSLDHKPFADRARWGGPAFTELPSAWTQMQTDVVALLPAPDDSYPVMVWYLPVVADLDDDADTFDGVAGWEEYIVWDVVCRLLNRDQYLDAYQLAAKHRDEVWADVMRGASVVSWMGPTTRGRDTLMTEPRKYLLGGPPSDAFTPAQVEPQGWYTASQEWCFQDTAGTIPCTDGTKVALWKSRGSVTGNDLEQTTAAWRPTFRQTGWNSRAATVEFIAASTNFMSCTGPLASAPDSDNALAQYMTSDLRTSGGSTKTITQWVSSPIAAIYSILQSDADFLQVGLSAILQSTGAISTLGRRRLGFFYRAANPKSYVNHALDIDSSLSMNCAGLVQFYLGNGWVPSYLDGHIQELVITNSADENMWERYLAYSYGQVGL